MSAGTDRSGNASVVGSGGEGGVSVLNFRALAGGVGGVGGSAGSSVGVGGRGIEGPIDVCPSPPFATKYDGGGV